jgi:hypothetical protein
MATRQIKPASYSVDQLKSLISSNGGMARTNLYAVTLPPIYAIGDNSSNKQSIIQAEELNILCKGTQLPGRHLTSVEQNVGMQTKKIAYGYQVQDVTLTFVVMNDYKVRKYFDTWQRLAIDYATGYVGYHDDYAKEVVINHLRKGFQVPIYNKDVASDQLSKVPSNIRNRLPDIPGPLGSLIGKDGLRTGEINVDVGTESDVMYQVKLKGAYPTSIATTELNNELDGLVELSVQLSFTNWYDTTEINEGLVGNPIEQFVNGLLNRFNVF